MRKFKWSLIGKFICENFSFMKDLDGKVLCLSLHLHFVFKNYT